MLVSTVLISEYHHHFLDLFAINFAFLDFAEMVCITDAWFTIDETNTHLLRINEAVSGSGEQTDQHRVVGECMCTFLVIISSPHPDHISCHQKTSY
jgi:hypothetical protein